MPPELQQMINAQQQAVQQAEFKMYFLGYTTYAAIIICAVFTVLIFWKLCQIQRHLAAGPTVGQPSRFTPPATPPAEVRVPSGPRMAQDDSRYMPKK
jgi:hypothetical protein